VKFQAIKLYLYFNQNLTIDNGTSYFESGGTVYSIYAVHEGLKFPWDITFINENEILVTKKSGRLSLIDLGTGDTSVIREMPIVSFTDQGGLLGVELYPDFSTNQVIYLSYTVSLDTGENQIQLLKARLVGNTLQESEVIFRVLPVVDEMCNLGGAIATDQVCRVFLSVGEHQSRENLQSKRSHLGAIIRLNDDGSIPADNPFVADSTAFPEIYSYGHHNPQGLSFDATTGTLWSAEHGPKGGGEINIIEPGKNYG